MKKKQGFTLIELLAVIVILAVIALIATPLIMGTITKAKLNSYKDTVYGILKAGEKYTAEILLESENTYQGETLDLSSEKKLTYKGTKPSKGNLFITKDGDLSITSEYAGYCFYKGYKDSEVLMSKGNCDDMYDYDGRLGIPTDKKCFETNAAGTTIMDYLCYEGNDKGLPTITEVNIPEEIKDGVKVTTIYGDFGRVGKSAFIAKNLTKINIPKTVTYIQEMAFNNNLVADEDEPFIYARSDKDGDGIAEINKTDIIGYAGKNKNVVIPEYVKTIGLHGNRAMQSCRIETLKLHKNITHIGGAAFQQNRITKIENWPEKFTMKSSAFLLNNLPTSEAIIYDRTVDGAEDKTKLNSYGGGNKGTFIIPSQVEEIGSWAMLGFQNVILNEGLKYIHAAAIGSSQKSITIPSTITHMEGGALENLTSLTTVVNKTGKPWSWGIMLGCTDDKNVIETGTVTCPNRTVQITK